MASTDAIDDITAFAEKNDANFPVLADPTKEAAKAFGVLSPIGYAKRWTFYINKAGVIEHIDRDVNPLSAGPDLAAHLQRLGYGHDAAAGS
jgi:peroxiredoxin Q/BCP